MPLVPLPAPKSPMVRVAGWAHLSLMMMYVIPVTMMISPLQIAHSITKFFSPVRYRRFNRWVGTTWWKLVCDWFIRIDGIRCRISGYDVPSDEQAIILCNHQSMADIPILAIFTYQKNRQGDIKWFVKDILKYVPGIGWAMLFQECIYVKRDWTKDEKRIKDTFGHIVKNQIPIWLFSFAEGTRMRPNKLAPSQAYAKSRGLPVLRHLLTPRAKGFRATISGLRTHADAVYDITIGYVGGVPSLCQLGMKQVKDVHLHVRRFAIDELPSDEQELTDWLYARYQEKDQLLEHFYTHGAFPSMLTS